MPELANLWVSVGANISEFQRKMQRVGTQTRDVGKKMTRIGGSMTKGLTLPVAGAAAGVVAMAADFQRSMNSVQAVTQPTTKQLKAMEAQAKELGRTTQFSASEAAEGMKFLGQAGLSAAEQMRALPKMLDLAAAGSLELGRASDISTDLMASFGLQVQEMGRINDVLAQTASMATTDIEMMAQAMSQVAPVAKSSGISLEETSAAVGVLASSGIKASKAGTQLRATIAKMEAPSKAQKEAMNELGVSFKDAEGKTVGLIEAVNRMKEAGADTGDIMEIFGRRAGTAMAALVQKGAPAIREFEEELENAQGRAQQMAETQMQGLIGMLKRLKSAFEGMALAIADAGVVDMFVAIAEKVRGVMQSIAEANPEMIKAGTIIAGVAAAAGPLVAVLGAVTAGLGALMSPIGAVVGVLGGLAAAITTAYVKSETFREVVNNAFKAVQEVAGPVIGWLGDKLGDLFGWLGGKLEDVAEWFGLASTSVTEDVREMGNESVAEITDMTQKMTDKLRLLGNDGKEVSNDLVDTWIGNVQKMKQKSVKAINEQYAANVAKMQELKTDVSSISDVQASNVIADMARQKNDAIAEANKQATTVEEKLRELKKDGVRLTAEMASGIIEQMERQRDGAIAAVTQQQEKLTNIMTRLKAESGRISVKMASDAIKQSAQQRDKTIKNAREEYRQRVASINDLWRESDTFTTKMRDDAIADARQQRDKTIAAARQNHEGFVNEIRGMREGVVDEVNLMTGEVRSGFEQMGRRMLEHIVTTNLKVLGEFTSMSEGALRTVHSMGKQLGSAVSSLGKALGRHFRDIVTEAVDHFQRLAIKAIAQGMRIVNWFADLPHKIINAIGDLAGTVGGWIKDQLGVLGDLSIDVSGSIGDGPGFGLPPGAVPGTAMSRAQKAMQGLPVRITSGYRTPAENERVGGSPTSYHMDRSNPAVDIGGPTWALDIVAARLREMNRNRELLWRTAGHFDHVHVAHEGGLVTRAGIEPLRGDEIAAKLQVGETVIPRGHDGASAGGDRNVEVNVYNPRPESAEESLSRQMRRLESVGVLE